MGFDEGQFCKIRLQGWPGHAPSSGCRGIGVETGFIRPHQPPSLLVQFFFKSVPIRLQGIQQKITLDAQVWATEQSGISVLEES